MDDYLLVIPINTSKLLRKPHFRSSFRDHDFLQRFAWNFIQNLLQKSSEISSETLFKNFHSESFHSALQNYSSNFSDFFLKFIQGFYFLGVFQSLCFRISSQVSPEILCRGYSRFAVRVTFGFLRVLLKKTTKVSPRLSAGIPHIISS